MADIFRKLMELEPIIWSYGLAAAVHLSLSVVLGFAVLRNHFAHKQFRPAIVALSTLCAVLFFQNASRVIISWLRLSGQTAEYLAFLASPWWLVMGIASAVAGMILFFTLVIAYPMSRTLAYRHKEETTDDQGTESL